jgi:hypothetical protein
VQATELLVLAQAFDRTRLCLQESWIPFHG